MAVAYFFGNDHGFVVGFEVRYLQFISVIVSPKEAVGFAVDAYGLVVVQVPCFAHQSIAFDVRKVVTCPAKGDGTVEEKIFLVGGKFAGGEVDHGGVVVMMAIRGRWIVGEWWW